jgi:hypothetical protein
MLTAAALSVLVGCVVLFGAILAAALDRIEERRLRRVAAQVDVTDAVHGALGAIVAPTVAGHRGQPWTVTMGLAPRDLALAGRLAQVADEALGRGPGGVRIVIVPRPEH